MKIRCRECKTIYDSKEKYCPFCYARTNPKPRQIRVDGRSVDVEKSIDTRPSRALQQSNYAARMQKNRSNQRKANRRQLSIWNDIVAPIISVLVIIFVLLSMFLF